MIRIQNIYHMLAYAFRVLEEQGYADVATEEFDNTAELCAAILARGISSQLKRGLGREYLSRTEALSSLRGKIEVTESIKTRSLLRRQLVCSHDEFSVDTRMNRILKATCALLVRSDIGKGRKKELRRLMAYFGDVGDIDPSAVDWHMRFDRNSQTYRMLMNVCWLVAKGLLQTQSDGTRRLMDFLDDQRMSRLYEKFVLEYFRREHPELNAGAPYIAWALDDGFADMLPAMRSDVTLARRDDPRRVLIIDAKYYSHATQQQFDKRTVHSHNLYQIFTYVKNKEAELAREDAQPGVRTDARTDAQAAVRTDAQAVTQPDTRAGARPGAPHEVSGMLLYAKTDEDVQPDATYRMSGNKISVRTLDLGLPFADIRAQLDAIAAEHFSDREPMRE